VGRINKSLDKLMERKWEKGRKFIMEKEKKFEIEYIM
jgi:hypothetical protein